MERIELTEMEKNLIERHLKYEIGYGTPEGEEVALYSLNYTKEEQKCMIELCAKAEALEDELDALDERMEVQGCDILLWYWLKYHAQQETGKQ